jgi:two-component system sensor histidine kinase PhcS
MRDASDRSTITDALLRDYREADLSLRVRQGKVAAVLVLVLVPACIGLDWFVYPELMRPFFAARLACDAVTLPFFIALFFPIGRRYVGVCANASVAAAAVAICWMIYASQGAASPYYAGLNLVIIGACLLFPYRLWEAIAFASFVLVSYVIACVWHRVSPPGFETAGIHPDSWPLKSTLPNNLYFIVLTSVLCATANFYSARRRFQDFVLRHDLDTNNRRLESTITRLKETEVQLVQSEKMNALGKLSAGLLHEVNNPLNYTFMALQIAEQEAAGHAGLEETLGDIHQGMERIKSVIADLRTFAYPSKVNDAEPLRLSDALTTALRLTAHELGQIEVVQAGVRDTVVLGAKTQVMHVLMNLLVNAGHAVSVPGLGRTPRIEVRCTALGERMEVAVLDNGVGVRPADLPKLLDPFFTTKEPGKGTGLGLSICHTIVRNHGGKIVVTSEHGQWTRVAFDLPIAPRRPSEVCA